MGVAQVEEKYSKLEEYLSDYIDSLAYSAKRRCIFLHYLRWHGILLPSDDIYSGFPSYSHWRFMGSHKITSFSF